MSDAVHAASAVQFTPSELVVLLGDRFAQEGGMLTPKEEVLASGAKVSAEQLAKTAMAAAVYAAARAGAVKLDHRTGKALFGLVKTKKVHLVPGAAGAAFPEGSVEAALVEGARGEPDLGDLFAKVLGQETYNAHQHMAAVIKSGLARRGLLEVGEKKMLKVFTTATFTLPAPTRAAVLSQDANGVKALLDDAERGDPELWKAVQKEIQQALVFMTKSND